MLRIIPLFLIRVYQYMLSPVLNPACRFYPTCAEYAYRAISRFGVMRGSFLALERILRCHPLSTGGFDPVPSKTNPGK